MSRNREFLVVLLLTAIAVSMVTVATVTDSYVPLFLAWLPYGAIPLILSRSDRMRSGTGRTPSTLEPPAPA